MLPLKIVTLNVRGMANPERRAQVFRFLRTLQAHVICLQEVHAPAVCDFWSTQWGGAASWNNFTAILFAPSLGSPTFDISHEGRVLASTFHFLSCGVIY
jgi:endonuclease/exonuclease/phosphatase family metal-dependent hydrolase